MRADLSYAALTRNARFVAVDVETTDSDEGVHVISVGVVPWAGGQSRGAFELFANPGCPIETTWIHGITDDDVADEPPFSTHLPALVGVLTPRRPTERVVLVAHNAGFDVPTLLTECDRAQATLPDVAVLDTMLLTKALRPGTALGLPHALAAFGLTITQHHRALSDAEDTTRLLERLLRLAADAGHTDLDELLTLAGPHTRTGAFTAAPQQRSKSRRGSPFTYIDRPATHASNHTKLPRRPNAAQLDGWLASVRECITLRCPLLLDRCRQLKDGHQQVATQLLTDLRGHLDAERVADANTTLSAMLAALESRPGPRDEALSWFQQLEQLLASHRRCAAATDASPYDACPSCRVDAPCPADTWPTALADWTLLRSQYRLHLHKWTGADGHLATTYAEDPLLATAQARAIAHNFVANRRQDRVDPAPVLDTAAALGMTDPRLAHLRARQLARAGHLHEAVAVCDDALANRDGSTDPAWADLTHARAGLLARSERFKQTAPARSFRPGRSAPANRPSRRRFTPW